MFTGRRPQNRAENADPRTEQHREGTDPRKRKVFCPWCLVFALSWLAAPVSFSGVLFSRPGPSLFLSAFLFLLLFLSIGRGRHVPAPGGRDVGSKTLSFLGDVPHLDGKGTEPRTGSFRYSLRTSSLCSSSRPLRSFPSTLRWATVVLLGSFMFRVYFAGSWSLCVSIKNVFEVAQWIFVLRFLLSRRRPVLSVCFLCCLEEQCEVQRNRCRRSLCRGTSRLFCCQG